MKNMGEFLSWVGVALITLLPIINPVSTAVLLLGISSHLSTERSEPTDYAGMHLMERTVFHASWAFFSSASARSLPSMVCGIWRWMWISGDRKQSP